MLAMTEPSMQHKPFEAGDGIELKILDDKILISAQCTTRLKEGNFLLEAEVIHIQAGSGIKISSKGKDTLVISCDLTKLEEKFYDLKKNVDSRLEIIEKIFISLKKQSKI
jgi:hypothetical protein